MSPWEGLKAARTCTALVLGDVQYLRIFAHLHDNQQGIFNEKKKQQNTLETVAGVTEGQCVRFLVTNVSTDWGCSLLGAQIANPAPHLRRRRSGNEASEAPPQPATASFILATKRT